MAGFKGSGFYFSLNSKTYIMGILNVTEDSFFDGGKFNSPEKALERALKIQADGASIIDIGAQSTRPNHIPKTAQEELDILIPVLNALKGKITVPISIDTFYESVAEYALNNGASIINDVSGVFNESMASLIKKYNAGWVVMHTGGGDASTVVEYSGNVVESVKEFFDDIITKCESFGIKKEQIMLDMGIGFGKSNDDNIELIRNIKKLKNPEIALLTALSCKRVIKNTSGADGDDLLFGTIAANTAAIMGGADFIRVHHIKEAVLAAKTADKLYRS